MREQLGRNVLVVDRRVRRRPPAPVLRGKQRIHLRCRQSQGFQHRRLPAERPQVRVASERLPTPLPERTPPPTWPGHEQPGPMRCSHRVSSRPDARTRTPASPIARSTASVSAAPACLTLDRAARPRAPQASVRGRRDGSRASAARAPTCATCRQSRAGEPSADRSRRDASEVKGEDKTPTLASLRFVPT